MSEEGETVRPSGAIASAREILQSVWGLLEKRLELATTELEEERHRLVNLLAWVAVFALLGLMALFTGTILIIVLTWGTGARLWVIAGLTLVYAGGAAWGFASLKRRLAQSPPPFAATVEEFKKDRAWFQKQS
jgi:uncharacterized membrane protein YqjE